MSAYILAQLAIHDHQRYERYARAFAATLEPFDGRLLVADPAPEVLEGSWPFGKVVLIQFRDRLEATLWAESEAYRAIAVDREHATDATVLALRSLADTDPWPQRHDTNRNPRDDH